MYGESVQMPPKAELESAPGLPDRQRRTGFFRLGKFEPARPQECCQQKVLTPKHALDECVKSAERPFHVSLPCREPHRGHAGKTVRICRLTSVSLSERDALCESEDSRRCHSCPANETAGRRSLLRRGTFQKCSRLVFVLAFLFFDKLSRNELGNLRKLLHVMPFMGGVSISV